MATILLLGVAAHAISFVFLLTVEWLFVLGLFARSRGQTPSTGGKVEGGVCPSDPPPYISILLPCYREAESLAATCARFHDNWYPANRHELVLLTEEMDADTTRLAVEMGQSYANVRHEIIPTGYLGHDHPLGKPRALLYGLTRLDPRTQVVGVIDAEDLVSPDALLQAAHALRMNEMVQGRIAIKNARETVLSYWLGSEYAFLEIMQTARDVLGWMKIPRGTTYFLWRHVIEEVGWSTRNLTEDLSLNVRIYARGYRVGLLETVTWEESPLLLREWLRQRSRWHQGTIQTIRERTDLSGLTLPQRLSVLQRLWHILLIPLLGLILTPLMVVDWAAPAASGSDGLSILAIAYRSLSLMNGLGIVLLCLEFAAATILCYRSDVRLWTRLAWCLLLPLLFVVLLPLATARACWREFTGVREWEKTHHRGETCCLTGDLRR